MKSLSSSEEFPGELHEFCDSFEELWQKEGHIKLAGFWEQISPELEGWTDRDRKHLARELVKLDLEFRWRRFSQDNNTVDFKDKGTVLLSQRQENAPRLLEDYLDLGIGLVCLDDMTIDLVLEEYRVRHLWGDRPNHQEYQKRFQEKIDSIEIRLSSLDSDLQSEKQRGTHQTTSLRHTEHQGLAGQTFGDYQLLEEIARGGMGVIYRARQISLDRIVAIKMILSGQLANQQDIERFRTEAQSAAKLTHPNIVRIYEIDQLDGQHFFSMRYVEGESLSDRLKQGSLGNVESAQLIKTITEAIHYAHQHDILHRDLKPQNILLDEKGQPWITDFGLSKKMSVDSDLTVTGQILGTPSYMPPEQANGITGKCEQASDIYSLGAILYELVTGRPPFQAPTAFDTLVMVMEKEPISPRQLNPGIDVDIETIILKCLQKNISRRYTSAKHLIDELERYLAGEPILARPVGQFARSWRWCQRNPLVASLVATIGIILVLSTFISLRYAAQARTEAHAANLAKQRADLQRVRAETARETSQRNLATATTERQRADQNAVKAKTNEQKARKNLLISERNTYSSDMLLIQQYWNEAKVAKVKRLIDRYGNQLHLRGFEWNYWKRRFRQELTTLSLGKGGRASSMSASHDNQLVAVAGIGIAKVNIWHIKNKEVIKTFRMPNSNESINQIRFSADSKYLVICNGKNTTIWNVAESKMTVSLEGHTDTVLSVDINTDGSRVVSGSKDRFAIVWDTKTGKEITRFRGHGHSVESVGFSPDGKRVVSGGKLRPPFQTGSDSKKTKIWDAYSGKEIITLLGNSTVNKASFSPDGRYVICGYQNGELIFWNSKTGTKINSFTAHAQGALLDFEVSRSRNFLVTSSTDRTAKVWDFPSGRPRRTLKGHYGTVLDVAVTDQITTLGEDKTIKIWNPDKAPGEIILKPCSNTYINSFAVSSNGKEMFGISANAIFCWNLEDGTKTFDFTVNAKTILQCFSINHDQRRFLCLTGSRWSSELSIWDMNTLEHIHTFPNTTNLTYVCYSPDGSKIACGSKEGVVTLWNADTYDLIATNKAHSSWVQTIAFSTDGTKMASGGQDRKIAIFSAENLRELVSLQGHRWYVEDLDFNSDGSQLLSCSGDGTIKTWDAVTGALKQTLTGHVDTVTSCQYSLDETRILSGSMDGTIKLWDVLTGRELFSHNQGTTKFTDVKFSPDGTRIIGVGDQNSTSRAKPYVILDARPLKK